MSVVLNPACDSGFYYAETLATLRTDILIRLGYAAQAASPPPGMASLIDNFLQRSQNSLYRKLQGTAGELERYFAWTMVEGERFYGLLANDDSCAKKLRRDQITGAWVEDVNGTWLPLVYGVNPVLFSSGDQPGLPCRYEVRTNIEVWPAPDQAYTLHIKGRFGLGRFTEDADTCSIDPDLLYLWALARAKNHYQQADANDIAAEAQGMFAAIVAASHGQRRYIPGAPRAQPLTKPVFLDMDS